MPFSNVEFQEIQVFEDVTCIGGLGSIPPEIRLTGGTCTPDDSLEIHASFRKSKFFNNFIYKFKLNFNENIERQFQFQNKINKKFQILELKK